MSEDIEPFEIQVDDATLDDLHDRLARTRFPDQIEGTGWEYGVPIDYLRQLVDYWRDTTTGGPRRPDSTGSTISAPPSTDSRSTSSTAVGPPRRPPPAHHPRLAGLRRRVPRRHPPADRSGGLRGPGRGCLPRGRPLAAGLRLLRAHPYPGVGRATHRPRRSSLYEQLGYARYGAQGGDWGAQVTTWIGTLDPEHCAAIHLNMALARRPTKPGRSPTRSRRTWPR